MENLRKPKKDGGYEDCGRSDTSKGSKPVCVPADKIKSLDKKEIENRKRQKTMEEKNLILIKSQIQPIILNKLAENQLPLIQIT